MVFFKTQKSFSIKEKENFWKNFKLLNFQHLEKFENIKTFHKFIFLSRNLEQFELPFSLKSLKIWVSTGENSPSKNLNSSQNFFLRLWAQNVTGKIAFGNPFWENFKFLLTQEIFQFEFEKFLAQILIFSRTGTEWNWMTSRTLFFRSDFKKVSNFYLSWIFEKEEVFCSNFQPALDKNLNFELFSISSFKE